VCLRDRYKEGLQRSRVFTYCKSLLGERERERERERDEVTGRGLVRQVGAVSKALRKDCPG
jgi:hypothetical protein